MNGLIVFGILIGLVALATLLGVLWRARTGRVRAVVHETVVDASDLGPGAVIGSDATLLQFSTSVCAPCRVTHSVLDELAGGRAGVSHVDVDITRRSDLANRYRVLQAPTTFILDGRGVVQARIGGVPRAAEVVAELDRILHTAPAVA
ncbi:TlpA family protein disulfide reductase [Parafrigoribacterium soli]|uniref:TlpA family protein disulfide reductase n=1 Tax=Parafrigoribacterium soli TaxID=3144663 RepID=UPI0032F08950